MHQAGCSAIFTHHLLCTDSVGIILQLHFKGEKSEISPHKFKVTQSKMEEQGLILASNPKPLIATLYSNSSHT